MNDFYITTITVTVASDHRLVYPDGYNLNLEDVAYEMTYGDLSGRYEYTDERKVTRDEIIRELEEQGSDPSFLLGDEWDDEYTEETLSAAELNEGIADY